MKIPGPFAPQPLVELGLHGERSIEYPSTESRWPEYLAGGMCAALMVPGVVNAQRSGPPDLVSVRESAQHFVIPPYTEAQRKNDAHLSRIFGGVAAANGYEPAGMRSKTRSGYRGAFFEGDLGHLQVNMHVYGSDDGNGSGPLYIPDGFKYLGAMNTENGRENSGHSFYYRRLGNQENVILRVFHVKDFAIDRRDKNEARSVRIGDIGGPGGAPYPGTTPMFDGKRRDYRHAHLTILEGRSNNNDSRRIPFYVAFPTPEVEGTDAP